MTKQTRLYGVIGLGRFGRSLARELATSGNEVIAADIDPKAVEKIRHYVETAYVADDISLESLRRMGFGECDTVIVCIGSLIDVSLLTVLHLKKLGIRRIIAKASSSDHGALLESQGAEVVFPEKDIGITIARRLSSRGVLESISLSTKVDITEVLLPESLNGIAVKDCGLRNLYHLNIVALRRGDEIITNIHPDEILRSSDILLLIGENRDLQKLLNNQSKKH